MPTSVRVRSVLDHARAHPGSSIDILAPSIGLAPIDYESRLLNEAGRSGVLTWAIADTLCRRCRTGVGTGWRNGDAQARRELGSALIGWVSNNSSSDMLAGCAEALHAIHDRLIDNKKPDGWCPQDGNDPVILDACQPWAPCLVEKKSFLPKPLDPPKLMLDWYELTFSPAMGMILGVDQDWNLTSVDPVTGVRTRLFRVTYDGGGRRLACHPTQPWVYTGCFHDHGLSCYSLIEKREMWRAGALREIQTIRYHHGESAVMVVREKGPVLLMRDDAPFCQATLKKVVNAWSDHGVEVREFSGHVSIMSDSATRTGHIPQDKLGGVRGVRDVAINDRQQVLISYGSSLVHIDLGTGTETTIPLPAPYDRVHRIFTTSTGAFRGLFGDGTLFAVPPLRLMGKSLIPNPEPISGKDLLINGRTGQIQILQPSA